jgi:nicotinamide-nucleotide amidase
MRGMLADELIPRLREMGVAGGDVVASRTLRTSGVPESRIADLVGDLPLPAGVTLAYLPAWEGVDLRVTIRGVPRALANERLAQAAATLRHPLGDMVFGENGADLAAVVLDALRRRAWTIGVGESCTGGMLGMRLTAIPGASDVVRGGVIAYANSVKIARLGVSESTLAGHGAVSVAVAEEMARGARVATGASVGVGITGIAGPDGGTAEKPVGTVCVAVAMEDVVESTSGRYVGDRDEVRRRATQAALMQVLQSCRSAQV